MVETLQKSRRRRHGIQFQGTITLGNLLSLLTLLGLLGTAITSLLTFSQTLQRTQDAIVAGQASVQHETQLREALMQGFGTQLNTLTTQEGRDIQQINQSITELRQDLRLLATRPQH